MEYPLKRLPWAPERFLQMLMQVLATAGAAVLQELLRETERLFRAEGYGAEFDAWGQGVPWMLGYGRG